MRIGLFTDFYHPAVNGVSYVVDIYKENLEKLGHEVYIVAPYPEIRGRYLRRDPHIIRFRAVQGLFFDEQLTSLFFPPKELKRIDSLKLDVILAFTPAQIGLMGVYAAQRLDIPVVMEYSTDLINYVEHYPAVMAGVFGLFLSAPVAMQLPVREVAGLSRKLINKQRPALSWRQDMIATMLGAFHSRCDAVVAVSEKVANQMMQFGLADAPEVIATGVDALPANAALVGRFARQFGLKPDDEVLMNVGRLAPEKNLLLLVDAFNAAAAQRPKLKLLFVGNYETFEPLRERAKASPHAKRIIFTGRIPHDQLGSMYALAQVFLFPSLTDTQSLTLNEASHAGLPIIWCDSDLNEVLMNGQNGYKVAPEPLAFAEKIVYLLENPDVLKAFSKAGRKRATQFSELEQTKKMAALLERVTDQRR